MAAALKLHDLAMEGQLAEIEKWPNRKSLCAGFNDAAPGAILAWNNRMAELVRMNDVAGLIDTHVPAAKTHLTASLTPIQQQWLDGQLAKADYSRAMRLHYYVGMALGDEIEVM